MEAAIDWQNNCRDIAQRGSYILQTEKWSDCSFLVGTEPNQQVLAGHKLILAMASPVFERMFYGNLPDKNEPILIPDVQPDAFRAMLEYIYSDKINIESFDKACELCYVAKKYILPHVVAQCTKYLWSDLSPRNACRAYEFAKLFEEPTLMAKCLDIISNKTLDVLSDSSFGDIEFATLLVIFEQPTLNIDSEMDLFIALSKYAEDRGMYKSKSNTPQPCDVLLNQSAEPQSHVEPMQDADGSEASTSSTSSDLAGEGTSDQNLSKTSSETLECMENTLIKQAVKKIRFLTLTPQQFAEGPARSSLLTQAEALAILINISSTRINDCPMPEGFSTSRIGRNCPPRCEEAHSSRYVENSNITSHNERNFTPSNLRIEFSPTPPMVTHNAVFNNYLSMNAENEPPTPTMETRKFYCVRTIRQQMDYRNTSVTDCSLTFQVDRNILITGVQVPTQVLCGEMMSKEGFTERYQEILYAHLLDAQGSRLTYTHCTSRVRYDSLLEISFDRPVFIHRHKMYKIGVVFNKVGWYPMYTCYPDVTCDGVLFTFNVGAPHESLRDGLIRAIVFTHSYQPNTSHGFLSGIIDADSMLSSQ